MYVYGPEVEQLYGTPTFVGMYLTAGLMGNAFSYAFGPFRVPSLGASGAVFGVVGILIAYLVRRRRSASFGNYLSGLLFFVGLNLFFGFTMPGINNWAHIGGLVGGLALGGLMDLGRSKPTPLLATASILIVAIAAVSLILWRTASLGVYLVRPAVRGRGLRRDLYDAALDDGGTLGVVGLEPVNALARCPQPRRELLTRKHGARETQ